ncbi:trihelix transcription factor ASIL2-like [Rhododendron vialii]|uniref:trihelix transcription factor ASIL2-like n=1 Tax=Rhododendron vialii TaxID=182163 RepID=UPI002660469F|nr:trihelix transcription factor ASIL2-like [Rhododendron vialii]
MSSPPPPEKPPRKFPAPCWTQSETLALIDAYRDRWYALRRGYLRTADWDAVAAAVTGRCPDASPAKTSAQCRHKMEKLRQRYRTEKQRSLSFPGHFFSSWFFFENMDSMAGDGSNPNPNPNLANKKIGTAKSNPNNQEGLRGKNSSPNYGSRVLNNGYEPYLEDGSDDDVGDDADLGEGYGVRTPIDVKLAPPVFRAKKVDQMHRNFGPSYNSNHGGGGYVNDGGFRIKPPRFDNSDGGLYVKISGERFPVAKGFRTKGSGKNDGNPCANSDPRFANGYSSSMGLGVGDKSGGRGGKRERDPIADVVSSIKLLGEGFVKVEKMKMEMAREIEKMRIEMDMKRNELILESQRQIVDAFVAVLMEKKKKKRESTPGMPES